MLRGHVVAGASTKIRMTMTTATVPAWRPQALMHNVARAECQKPLALTICTDVAFRDLTAVA